jgi:hypothetical protein
MQVSIYSLYDFGTIFAMTVVKLFRRGGFLRAWRLRKSHSSDQLENPTKSNPRKLFNPIFAPSGTGSECPVHYPPGCSGPGDRRNRRKIIPK